MSQERSPDRLLTHAFEGFERAATQLQERHAELKRQVESLEHQLGDADRCLEAVVDGVESGVAVLTGGGEILRANRAFESMGLGAPGTPADADVLRLTCGDPSRGGTLRLRRTTPRGERDLTLTLVPVGDEEGTAVLTVQDVTDIRREEQEGGRRRRLEALGRMAAELAHEVRNPLGSIKLFASLLRDDLGDRQELSEMAERILESSSSLEATVSNLLAFAAPSRAEKKSLDLGALAVDACALFAPTCALRGVELEQPRAEQDCRVWADPEAMRQVLLNLLGNALAATPGGGRIRVHTARRGGRAVLVVEDTGSGIPPEDLPRVFDPFFSRSEGGTGLGLSVVHGIVERHQGRISLDSGPGSGTRARVEFPAEVVAGGQHV